MLKSLTKKLCPLMSLAITTLSCGKKISESHAGPTIQTQNQVLPSSYVLRLDGLGASWQQTRLPKNAQFEVPSRIRVRAGDSVNKVVELSFDVNNYDSEDFQFKCIYQGVPSEADLILDKCINYDGDHLGDVRGYIFTLYQNDIIQINFTGDTAQDLIVDAVFSMRWI